MEEDKSMTATLITIVPKEIHSQVKIMAALRGISIQRYVAQAVLTKLSEDQKRNS